MTVLHSEPASAKYTLGWGLNTGAAYTFDSGVVLRGVVTHGDGIGGYSMLNPGGAGYLDENGGVKAIEASAATVGVTVPVGPGAFNASYAMVKADLDDVQEIGRPLPTPYDYDRYDSVFVNYIWSPIDRVSYGLEVAHHTADRIDGGSGDTTRIQGMVRYTF